MWKPVIGYEAFYEVSDTGAVRRIAGRGCTTSHEITPIKDRHGYYRVKLCVGGKAKDYYVHRLAVEAFIGPIPDGMTVNHMDCNRENNAIENLEVCTRHENTLHAVANGLVSLSNATLMADEASMIYFLTTEANMASIELSRLFSVSRPTINRITSGRHWGHLRKKRPDTLSGSSAVVKLDLA